MKNDALGNRMKRNYELPTRHYLTRRVPVVIRVDGRAFHTLTKEHFKRPFDSKFIDAMVVAAISLAGEMQGFKLGYVQSDEASFVLTDYDNITTEPWFGYCQNKIETISSALMTFVFTRCLRLAGINKEALFDARAFNIPEDEVANYFLWRARDWHRNSISMYTRAYFSHKQLHHKRVSDMHEMLHSVGHNWSVDLTNDEKNGTFILTDGSTRSDIESHFKEINELWQAANPTTADLNLTPLSSQAISPNILNEPVAKENDLE